MFSVISDGPLPTEHVEKMLRHHGARIELDCIAARLPASMGAWIEAHVVVDEFGQTTFEGVATRLPPGLARCVEAKIRKWKFAMSEPSPTTVRVMFRVKPLKTAQSR